MQAKIRNIASVITRKPMQIKYLQVLVMPNGEIISCGKTVGWLTTKGGGIDGKKTFADFLFTKEEVANVKE